MIIRIYVQLILFLFKVVFRIKCWLNYVTTWSITAQEILFFMPIDEINYMIATILEC